MNGALFEGLMRQRIHLARLTVALKSRELEVLLASTKGKELLANPAMAQLWLWADTALRQSKELAELNQQRALAESRRDIFQELLKFSERLGPDADEQDINNGISELAASVLRNCGPRATNKN